VPNMAVFCSSLTSWFPRILLTYFLNDFEMVPVAPITTGKIIITVTIMIVIIIKYLSLYYYYYHYYYYYYYYY
jgi:hypothetical protein